MNSHYIFLIKSDINILSMKKLTIIWVQTFIVIVYFLTHRSKIVISFYSAFLPFYIDVIFYFFMNVYFFAIDKHYYYFCINLLT